MVHAASSACYSIFACSFRAESWLRHMSFFSLHHLKTTKCWSRWKKKVVREESEYTVLERMGLFDLGDAAFEPFFHIFLTQRKSLLLLSDLSIQRNTLISFFFTFSPSFIKPYSLQSQLNSREHYELTEKLLPLLTCFFIIEQ